MHQHLQKCVLVVCNFSIFLLLLIKLPFLLFFFFISMSQHFIFFLLQICFPLYCLLHPTGLVWQWNFTQLPVSSSWAYSKNGSLFESITMYIFSHAETMCMFKVLYSILYSIFYECKTHKTSKGLLPYFWIIHDLTLKIQIILYLNCVVHMSILIWIGYWEILKFLIPKEIVML